MNGIVVVIYLAIIVLLIAAAWQIFTKAGEAGWKCLIPIYNLLVLLKIVGRPWWWIILWIIPIVGIVIALIVALDLAKSFGKGGRLRRRLVLPRIHLRADPRVRQRHVRRARRAEGNGLELEAPARNTRHQVLCASTPPSTTRFAPEIQRDGGGDQEQHGIGDVARRSKTLERRRRQPARDAFRPRLGDRRRLDQPRRDAVHPDSRRGRARARRRACA